MVVQSPLKSEGHRALREYLARMGIIASEFARRTKLAKTLVGMIINCEVPAGPKSARVISAETRGEVHKALWLDRATVDPLSIEIPKSLGGRPASGGEDGGKSSRALTQHLAVARRRRRTRRT